MYKFLKEEALVEEDNGKMADLLIKLIGIFSTEKNETLCLKFKIIATNKQCLNIIYYDIIRCLNFVFCLKVI